MKRILVVGATSAVASAMARLWARRGDRLYLLGGRDAGKLAALVTELGPAVAGQKTADFDETDANASRVAHAIDALGGLDVALVAHGYLGDQLASERDVAEAQRILHTNLLSTISLLIPLANHFEAARAGSLAVISSVAADRGRPRNFTYAAAKAALNTYLEGTRSRLWHAGVSVHAFKLGPVESPMTVDHPKNALFATPERVAADMVRAIDRHVPVAYVPWFWAPIMFAVRHMPEPLFQKIRFLSGR